MNNLKRPCIMGILNITPDSFSDGSTQYKDIDYQLARARTLIAQGADIIDIGGESTRPGAAYISPEQELERIMPVVEALRRESPITLSIDTNKAVVAEAALTAGANIINDITGLNGDPKMADIIAKHNSEVVIMHMQGTPSDMQNSPKYADPTSEVIDFLTKQLAMAQAAGIERDKVILDPGFGFGKRFEDNCNLLQHTEKFCSLSQRVLIGISRKSLIGHALNLAVEQRLEASLALAVMTYLQGAEIFRVHDVMETRRALDMIYKITQTH